MCPNRRVWPVLNGDDEQNRAVIIPAKADQYSYSRLEDWRHTQGWNRVGGRQGAGERDVQQHLSVVSE